MRILVLSSHPNVFTAKAGVVRERHRDGHQRRVVGSDGAVAVALVHGKVSGRGGTAHGGIDHLFKFKKAQKKTTEDKKKYFIQYVQIEKLPAGDKRCL